MKRITYISEATQEIDSVALNNLATVSQRNNKQIEITGVLVFLKGLFFQVIEGEETALDQLYHKIAQDPRHQNINCLKTELAITERLFAEWSMKTINLGEAEDLILTPVKLLLQAVTESHRILEHYTQPSVLRIIKEGRNPLKEPSKLVNKIVLFSDIIGFSTFTEKLPVEDVVQLVNRYLTICTQSVTRNGGEVVKFIGDAMMASFNEDQADAALQTALDILTQLKQLRDNCSEHESCHWLYTGIGIAAGSMIEGNVGFASKMDYTLLGDAVNIAARLEASTRHLMHSLVFTDKVRNTCHQEWSFIPLGQYEVKGKEEWLEVYSIANSLTQKSPEIITNSQHIREVLERYVLVSNNNPVLHSL